MNRIYLAAITALLTLTACGGGGGGGNDPTGGIDGRGTAVVAQGMITGKGSIIVNGVEYETDSSEIEIDGEVGFESELEIGDVVLISGTVDDNGTTGTATTVTFDDVVEGPVTGKSTTVTAEGQTVPTLIVLGQTVQVVDGETLFDDTPPLSYDTIAEGDVIEVSGYRLAGGNIRATRIEGKPAGGVFEVTGVVSGLSGTTFMIGDLTVDFTGVTPDDSFPGGSVQNGDPVEVKGSEFAGGELTATSVEYKGGDLGAAAGSYMELEGYITSFDSIESFEVSGFPVIAAPGVPVEGTGPLGVNVKVEVEGTVNSSGVLVADNIEIKTSTGIRAVGLIDQLVPLQVLGITINASDLTTRFKDNAGDTPLGDDMKLANLRVGDYVEVRGQEQPQGQITAYTLERDDFDPLDPRFELRGFVTAEAQPFLTVLGVTIATDDSTLYFDSRGDIEVPFATPAEFWAAVQENSLVDARGASFDSGSRTLTAEEVEIQEDPPAN